MASAQMVRFIGLLNERLTVDDEFTKIRDACEYTFDVEHASSGDNVAKFCLIRKQRTPDGNRVEAQRWRHW